jgi:hypothetical protein
MSDQTTNSDALEQRLTELEQQVKEIGNVVYEMVQEMRENGNIDAMRIPVCPPICPRD